MYMLNGWWFLSSGGSYPPVFAVVYTPFCQGTQQQVSRSYEYHIL